MLVLRDYRTDQYAYERPDPDARADLQRLGDEMMTADYVIAEKRAEKLRAWLGLPAALYAELEDGTRVRATYDERQVGEDRLSSVQYLKFPVGAFAPQALGVDHPELVLEASLTPPQREALQEDLTAPEARA